MSKFFNPVLLAIDPQPSDIVVTITGMVLVFAILVLLMLIITLEGKIFDGLNNKKNAKKDADIKAASSAKPAAPAVKPAAPVAAPAPVVEQGIPGEIVAVIAAAIAAMGGGKYVLRAVHRADRKNGAWTRAGVNDVTSPF